MRIAIKFTIALIIGMCLLLGGQAYLQVQRERGLFEDDMAHDDLLMGRWLATAAAELWETSGPAPAQDLVERADRASTSVRIHWVRLTDVPRGPSVASSPDSVSVALASPSLPPELIAQVSRGSEQVVIQRVGSGGAVYTYVPVFASGAARGALELVESLSFEHEYLRASTWRNAVTALVLICVSTTLTLVLGYYLIGVPARTLIQRAQRVGRGDLLDRLPVRSRDELSALAAELNKMCEHLEEAGREVAHQNLARLQAVEQLRRADRLRIVGQLASGVAHELGTPLNIIGVRAKAIAHGELDLDNSRTSAAAIAQQSDRIGQSIRLLLDFARPRHPERRPVDLGHIASQTAALLAPIAGPKGAVISVDTGSSPIVAQADAAQLQQVLSNLIVNSIQAMPTGGKVEVRVASEKVVPTWDPGAVPRVFGAFHIRDEGVGIAEEVRRHMFEPFFTTKAPGEGTGLGLAISASIIYEHGGWISADSAPGQGACFSVYVPQEVGPQSPSVQ
jgi:signal transduction histidine kinase